MCNSLTLFFPHALLSRGYYVPFRVIFYPFPNATALWEFLAGLRADTATDCQQQCITPGCSQKKEQN